MIHGKSVEKVNIKKISLRSWSLTDEIDETVTLNHELIDNIKQFYEKNKSAEPEKPNLTLVQNTNTTPAEVSTDAQANLEVVESAKPIPTLLEIRKNCPRVIPKSASHGKAILYDINFEFLLFFSSSPYKPGQQIVIEFLVPRSFTMIAEVTYIAHVGVASRIISEIPTPYRLKAKFMHQHPGDSGLLKYFLSAIDQRTVID
jgi:hypothetical protein